MINIGFLANTSIELMGKTNYLKNLIFAIDSLKLKSIQIHIFIGKKTNIETKNFFKNYANVVENSMFDRKSLSWYLNKIESKIIGTNLILENFLNKHKIQIISHSSIISLKKIKMINWIPDFQHIHIPYMFSDSEIKKRNKYFKKAIKNSDVILLSSYDALKDFKNFDRKNSFKAKVLQFVSQPHEVYYKLNNDDKKIIFDKYNLKNDYFYIPNQYWKHKNHILVFKVINELKNEGVNINLICTGYPDDYRNKGHYQSLKNYIKENNLNKNINMVGLVSYKDVFSLIKFSKAVINPSLFEGWSSTVEECKSVGKNMIISDLNVHKEQYPNATFFVKNNTYSLKQILKNYKNIDSNNTEDSLTQRTKQFALNYINIVEKLKVIDL